MRIVLLAIALAIALPVSARTVSDSFDRIGGERTITYTADGSRDSSRPVFTFNASFAGAASSVAISLAFVSASEGSSAMTSRFAACHSVDWFVDGQSLAAGPASHRGDVVDGEMIELIDQEVTPLWAAAIANAQEVRYRVCRDEYAFTPSDIEAFGMIAAKLKNAALLSPAIRAGVSAAPAAKEVDYKGMNWRPKHQESLFPTRK